MKYNETNKPLVCMLSNSYCYKTTAQLKPVGVLWHSTGCNNPTLKRYVQPADKDPNKAKLLALLGTNINRNDLNHTQDKQGLNAWIGKLADGSVAAVQTMPWNYAPYGCGTGSIGSCNGWRVANKDTNLWVKECWIQFEICEDNLQDANYAKKVFEEGCQLTAYLCKLYGFDPNGTVNFLARKVPVITCHKEVSDLKLGSNHGDVLHWFPKFGITMDTIRKRVTQILNENKVDATTSTSTSTSTATKPQISANTASTQTATTTTSQKIEIGDLVSIADDAVYWTGKIVPTWIKAQNWYVYSIDGNRAVINFNETKVHTIMSAIDAKYLKIVKKSEESFIPYRVRVIVDRLNYRAGAGSTFKVNGVIADRSVYTIVAHAQDAYGDTWGKLKSGAGWINLRYTQPI